MNFSVAISDRIMIFFCETYYEQWYFHPCFRCLPYLYRLETATLYIIKKHAFFDQNLKNLLKEESLYNVFSFDLKILLSTETNCVGNMCYPKRKKCLLEWKKYLSPLIGRPLCLKFFLLCEYAAFAPTWHHCLFVFQERFCYVFSFDFKVK